MDKQMNECSAMFVSLSRTGKSSTIDDVDDDDLPAIIPTSDLRQQLQPNPDRSAPPITKLTLLVSWIPSYRDHSAGLVQEVDHSFRLFLYGTNYQQLMAPIEPLKTPI
jgi:hypothetical protein